MLMLLCFFLWCLQRYDQRKQGYVKVDIPRSNNAYLVVYDRVKPPEDYAGSPVLAETAVPASSAAEEKDSFSAAESMQVSPSLVPAASPATGAGKPEFDDVSLTPSALPSGGRPSRSASSGGAIIAATSLSSAVLHGAAVANPPLFRDNSYSSYDFELELGTPATLRFGTPLCVIHPQLLCGTVFHR